ncbi:MAG: glycosyltransferase family 39 protein [Candidatus Eremiobacteraeota bacterium]|nr:glycosyltransferase family 39 protein [Candidatus Eremiobacteraeota bacterium]MBV8222148.1 glycosyltransferase family 39 protein [Candidatus Eremiobacteraeota bacterium]
MTPARLTALALGLIVLLGCALRLIHIRDPILDHPGWRQGDQAAIARNFAQLQDNIFYPQVDYDGPPPNYIELELQIAPFTAAQLYRAFGVHPVIGRTIVMLFSLGTIVLLYFLGAELLSPRAGLIAALLFAIAPGAVYYGRTLTPDSVMVFFMTGTLLFWWRWCMRRAPADFAVAFCFGALAWLAKPPALLILVPLIAVPLVQRGWRAFADWSLYVFIAGTLLPFALYFHHVQAIAEWHWFSGITQKHVLPTLRAELSSASAFFAGVRSTLALLPMLSSTILGPVLFGLALGGSLVIGYALRMQTLERPRELGWLLIAWTAVLCAYAFVVVNVERVDYYLLPWLPLAALVAGLAIDVLAQRLAAKPLSWWACAAVAAAIFITAYSNMLEIRPYYAWSARVYSWATRLDAALAPGSIVVMGHYGPDVLYLIDRKGWEEDPLVWTPFDMESAVRKGARYFIAVEPDRLKANPELHAYLERFAQIPTGTGWPVYDMTRKVR